jgi:hypothetical protein
MLKNTRTKQNKTKQNKTKQNKYKNEGHKNRKTKTKKMFGGFNEPNTNVEKKPDVPTVMSNLKNAGNLASSVAMNWIAKSIQKTADTMGVNPNASVDDNVKLLSNKVENINNALKSAEGEKLKNEANELFMETVDILKPSVDKAMTIGNNLLEKEIPIIGNMANEAVLMVPGAGTVIGAIEEAGNVAQASEAAAEGVANLTVTGTEAVKKMEEQKKKAEGLWDKLTNVASNVSTDINKSVANGINMLQQRVDKEGSKIKNLHKEALMVGGRAKKSHLDFLAPHVNRSQILRQYQYGGKYNNKTLKRRKM